MESINSQHVIKSRIKSYLKYKLSTNEVWAKRALLLIYKRQTSDERESALTKYDNKVGFNGLDAEFLTSLSKQIEEKGFLTGKQVSALFKTIPKYWEQILSLSDRTKLEKMIREDK